MTGQSADDPTVITITSKRKPRSQPPQTSQGRRPRGVLKINGANATFLGFDVTNNTHFNADRWRAEMEVWNQPEGFGLDFWNSASDVQVECLMGLLGDQQRVDDLPSDPTSMILGQVDNVDIDPLCGTITLSGRDLTAKLIDMKTTAKWPDAVASYVVTQLAQQAGLTANATTTTTPVGQYADGAYASLAREIPAWDIIIFLAQQEGFDAYVSGSTLYFGPPEADGDTDPLIIFVTPPKGNVITSNATRVRFGRSLTLAADLSVTVLSHSVKGGSIKATATRAGTKPTGSSASKGGENVQNYTIRRPGLTQEQAQQLANKMLADITKQERTLDVTTEGDPTMSVRRQIKVTGTGTTFDQSYFVNQIERSYRFGGAFEMEIKAKNHPTESDSTL